MWVYLNMETYELKPIRLSLPTALGNAFFSEFNRAGIQQSIASAISEQTGYELAPQNDGDVQSLMRVVYTDLVNDPNTNVRGQVNAMNSEVVRRATADAFQKALEQCGPQLLEPIMKLDITTPDDHMGDIVADLQQRRAMITETMLRGKTTVIRAEAPLANLFGYSSAIRSLSQGRASCSMEPSAYGPAPRDVLESFML